ncbi:MAG: DNA-directed RNA polymerase subunit omega [Bacilli bacterium]|jgi:DNA-directed RNA polymerase subunit omega
MIYPSIDKLLNIIGSKYQLVHVVARRSKQMFDTSFYQLKEGKYQSSKDLGRALEEVGEGLIKLK